MNKTWRARAIAVAMVGLAGASVHAADDLSMEFKGATLKLYGVADVAYANMSGKLNATTSAGTSTVSQDFSGLLTGGFTSSRLGFAADAPFGTGYSGLFVLELGPTRLDQVSSGITNGLDKTRKSFVGLKGDFGTVIGGRLQTPAFDWSSKYDALSGALDPVYNIALAGGNGINSADRLNDAVTYTSPDLYGFTVKATYAMANSSGGQSNLGIDDATLANHQQKTGLVSVDYDNGPLSLGLVYRNAANSDGMCANLAGKVVTCATAGSSAYRNGKDEWGIGGIYDFRVVKLFASWQTAHMNLTRTSNHIASVGLQVPTSAAGRVIGVYANGSAESLIPAGQDGKAQSFTLAYAHDMNKYLTLYAGAFTDKNGAALFGSGLQLSNRTAAANVTPPVGTTYSSVPNSNQSGLMAGLRVTF
jgi:predicted porin